VNCCSRRWFESGYRPAKCDRLDFQVITFHLQFLLRFNPPLAQQGRR